MTTATVAELSARFDQSQAAIAALHAQRGEMDLATFDKKLDRLADRRDAIIDEIEQAPGVGLPDLILKARALKSIYPEGPALACDDASQDMRLASQIIEGLASLLQESLSRAAGRPAAAPMTPRSLFRVREAAEALSISEDTVYRMIASGKIKSTTVGKLRRIPVAEVERLGSA